MENQVCGLGRKAEGKNSRRKVVAPREQRGLRVRGRAPLSRLCTALTDTLPSHFTQTHMAKLELIFTKGSRKIDYGWAELKKCQSRRFKANSELVLLRHCFLSWRQNRFLFPRRP